MPADDYTGDNSSLKDILEIISKRLSNLETKIFTLVSEVGLPYLEGGNATFSPKICLTEILNTVVLTPI